MPEQTKGLLPTETYRFCIESSVVCSNSIHKHHCPKCLDITKATKFLLKKLKPESGTLNTGIMNNDYAAFLMTEFFNTEAQRVIDGLVKENENLNSILKVFENNNSVQIAEKVINQQALIEKLAEALKEISELEHIGLYSDISKKALQLHQDYKSKQK